MTIVILCSCECTYDYSYEVENQTNSVIKVKWIRDYGSNIETYDSLMIKPHEADTLFVTTHGIEPCRDGPFFEAVDRKFKTIKIIKADTLFSKLDYTLNEQWDYNNGHYKATVTETEF